MINCTIRTSQNSLIRIATPQAGLDSLGALELRTAIAERFAVKAPATLAFDYPTIAALAKLLTPLLERNGEVEHLDKDITADARDMGQTFSTDVIGTACIYPGSDTGTFLLISACSTIEVCNLLQLWEYNLLRCTETGHPMLNTSS